ncbi:hypothetical protein ACTMTF_24250 [Nonomuraea sp. ZG12]|uniref:hypothetical protein n=1 Tax=Nonomuraea sp. ZG12 TaxID=3452207 RepID=UPI003F8CBD1C
MQPIDCRITGGLLYDRLDSGWEVRRWTVIDGGDERTLQALEDRSVSGRQRRGLRDTEIDTITRERPCREVAGPSDPVTSGVDVGEHVVQQRGRARQRPFRLREGRHCGGGLIRGERGQEISDEIQGISVDFQGIGSRRSRHDRGADGVDHREHPQDRLGRFRAVGLVHHGEDLFMEGSLQEHRMASDHDERGLNGLGRGQRGQRLTQV